MKTGALCLDHVTREIFNCETHGDTKAELHLFAKLICDAINEQLPELKLTTHVDEGSFLTIKNNGGLRETPEEKHERPNDPSL